MPQRKERFSFRLLSSELEEAPHNFSLELTAGFIEDNAVVSATSCSMTWCGAAVQLSVICKSRLTINHKGDSLYMSFG